MDTSIASGPAELDPEIEASGESFIASKGKELESHQLLQELLLARGPSGQEREVAEICQRELQKHCDEISRDSAGNVIGVIRADVPTSNPPLCLMAHMDELSLIVKRVEDDGRLIVRPLGGIEPVNFGQGAVDIVGSEEVLPGALSFGAMHVSHESKTWEIKGIGGNQPANWGHVSVITRLSKEDLAEAGVIPGARVVLAESRRGYREIGDCLAGYFMDNRAALTSMILCAEEIKRSEPSLKRDIYFMATTQEEFVGTPGACFAARQLETPIIVALDVVPVAPEYSIELNPQPVVVFGDERTLYDTELSQTLMQSVRLAGHEPSSAVLESYRTDASSCKELGITPVVGVLGIPTENTHGYEVIHRDSIKNTRDALVQLLSHYDGDTCH